MALLGRKELLAGNWAVKRGYMFSNENTDQYMPLMNTTGRVFCVGCGEQVMSAISHGAKDVTAMDANPNAEHFIGLLKSAVQNLTHKEFSDLYSFNGFDNVQVIQELLPDCKDETAHFWLDVIEKMKDDFRKSYIKRSLFFRDSFDDGKNSILFTQEDRYNDLKSKLSDAKITFEDAEYSEFPEKMKGKYSSILISNIYDYYNFPELFFDVAKSIIDGRLEKDGTMQMQYEWDVIGFEYNMARLMPEYKPCKKYIVRDRDYQFKKPSVIETMLGKNEYPRPIDYQLMIGAKDNVVHIYEKE